MSVVNWEALELTAPLLENSLASYRGIFGHSLTLALVLDHGSRAPATGWLWVSACKPTAFAC